MPELPEVETIRRGLATALGLESADKCSQWPLLRRWHFARENLRYPLPIANLQALEGCHLLALERRSKYLLLYFSRDLPTTPPSEWGPELPQNIELWSAQLQLWRVVVHLGMTGVLRALPELPPQLHKHDHLWLCLQTAERECYLLYNDVRRFGFWSCQDCSRPNDDFEDFNRRLATLGPEPIPWRQYRQQAPISLALLAQPSKSNKNESNMAAASLGERLYSASRSVRRGLKPWLLDGKAVCGVGNIYCSESLWLAKLSPRKEAATLSSEQAERLAAAIQQIIAAALAAGGTTLKDFRNATGKEGLFQQELRAYGRQGQNCPRCTERITKIVQGGRATYYCPLCQK